MMEEDCESCFSELPCELDDHGEISFPFWIQKSAGLASFPNHVEGRRCWGGIFHQLSDQDQWRSVRSPGSDSKWPSSLAEAEALMDATATDVVLVLRARPRLAQHEEHTDAAPEAQTTALGVERRHSSTGKQGPVHEALQGREGEHRVK